MPQNSMIVQRLVTADRILAQISLRSLRLGELTLVRQRRDLCETLGLDNKSIPGGPCNRRTCYEFTDKFAAQPQKLTCGLMLSPP